MEKKKSSIWAKIGIVFACILAILTGGFFFLDKYIVPRYFSVYGIYNLSDLVGVVGGLYNSPKESKLVTNGYSTYDLNQAIYYLNQSGYAVDEQGTIEKDKLFVGTSQVELTDKELAAFCNKMIQDNMLEWAIPSLNLNLIEMEVLQISILPIKNDEQTNEFQKARIGVIVKIETDRIREQMSVAMETPKFLLDMIIPDTMYFSLDYLIDLSTVEPSTSGTIAINGRTAEQSQILINLLVKFIFPEDEEMNLSKFSGEIGKAVLQGINEFGDFTFIDNAHGLQKNGIKAN